MAENELLSSLLTSGAAGYGSAAAAKLLERRRETAERFGQGAFRSWSGHLAQRSRELAAAILVDEPKLFGAEVAWSAVSFSHREVPLEDLEESLECLHETLLEELPEHLRDSPDRHFQAARERLAEPPQKAEPSLGDETPENQLALRYLDAALGGRRRKAIDLVLGALENGTDVHSAYEVLHLAQSHVGDLWHAHQLSVAQEHFVTATTESVMTLLGHRASSEPTVETTVVVSPVPGNAHELGAKTLAHCFEIEGWNTIYLGGELPADQLAVALEAFDARLLALSVALSTQLEAAMEAIRAARTTRSDVQILVGGRLFGEIPELWRKLGADGSAPDFSAALREADRLVGS